MLLPASSSFVTGVIKERARASTLPPRLSFFRPAALVGGREEGEMEGGGGRSPTLRQSLQKRTLAQPECDETGECARPLRDRRYRQEGRQGEGYKDARERAGTTEPDSGLLLLPRLVASRGMVVGEKNSGARRRGAGGGKAGHAGAALPFACALSCVTSSLLVPYFRTGSRGRTVRGNGASL